MQGIKVRLLALLIIAVSLGLTYYNWQQLLQEGRYSMKLAAFAPVGAVGGLYLLLFPSMGGKPANAKEKFMGLLVFGIGLLAGLYNWSLMDPGFFSGIKNQLPAMF